MVTDDPLTARSADVRTLLNRKPSFFAIVAVAALSTIAVVFAQAPNPAGGNAPKYGVAVVDIPYIFKNYERFRVTTDGMKKEMEKIDADVKADRANIARTEQQRNTF